MAGRRVVAIVGKSPITREMANLEPASVEIWGLSDDYLFLDCWDRWFEMHLRAEDDLYWGFASWDTKGAMKHLEWLWDCGVPVFMQAVDERIPTSQVFPFHEVGSRYRPYWTSTVAYMLSLAAYEKVDELHLWGVEMAGATEYEQQKPCCEYWLGVLETQGCELVIPDSCPLLKPGGDTYGFATRRPMDAATIRDEIAKLDARIQDGRQTPTARRVLVDLLGRADPATRGKPIISPVIRGEEIEASQEAVADVLASR